MAINTGVNISKAVGYAVLDIPRGVDITKAVGYAVLNTINPPIWPSLYMPNGTLMVPYSITWDLAPASAPTTYSVIAGAIPTGLALSSPSDDLGTISGTPTVLGTFGFTLRATNAFGTADKVFSITISAASSGGAYTFIG